MKSHAIVTLLITSFIMSAGDLSQGQGPEDVKVLKTRQKDFEVVWQTIAESYFDPTFGGVDWKRVRQQYEPKLPSGARLIYPMGECKTANGTLIEGRGVIPDVEVKLSRALLLRKGDPQLEEAIKIIKSKVEKAKTASN